MNESLPADAWHRAVLHLPILTTLCSAVFATALFRRLIRKGGGPHLLWWGIGMVTYGLGTITESWTTLVGWNPVVFKLWYVFGAFLGGYPLAQGSIYLLSNRRFADWSARIVSTIIVIGAIAVFLSPLDLSVVEAHRLSGKALAWQEVRMLTPFINLYSLIFLAGGAALSAFRFRRDVERRDRYVGNIFIATGAILPGIGGTMTRFGLVEALYVTELVGLLLIFVGYRRCVKAPAPSPSTLLKPAAALVGALLVLAAPAAVSAQETDDSNDASAPVVQPDGADASTTPEASFFGTTTVTATGSERDTFEVATPVTVITSKEIERLAPDNPADLLREQPGVDVNGVGPNQARPVIRGQRGLRVLFLEDGLRLNNARRQTDFGEISGLVDLDSIQTVEVVRGPASVLYGSDAIGGVLNVVTGSPSFVDGRNFAGGFEARYTEAGERQRGSLALSGRADRFDWQVGLTQMDSVEYEAPSGSFGDVTLSEKTPVLDTGLDDDSQWASFGWNLDESQSLRFRLNRYSADQTGFGFVDPAAYAPGEDKIRIYYPYQDFERYAGYYLGTLGSAVADSLDVKAYYQNNERQLANDIESYEPSFSPFFIVDIDTLGYTKLETKGVRVEGVKALPEDHLLTWGLEGFQDDSTNTDHSETFVGFRFPFPPFEVAFVDSTDDVANAPNATNSSWGVFLQDEWTAAPRLRLTGGLRYQQTSTKAEATPGWDTSGLDFDDNAVVGSVTATWQLRPELNLLASYGTAFRAPNIIERLFNGVTPEGSGYQILNPDLSSEKSDNIDFGIKYRRQNAFMELVVFRTEIDDGIIQHYLTDDEIAALPADQRAVIENAGIDLVVQQRNTDRLRYEGLELAAGYRTSYDMTVGLNYTYLDAQRIDSTNPPTGDTYGDKYVFFMRWEPSDKPFWVEYRLRHNESTKANLDPGQPVPPIGTVLPSFTVQSVAGGVTLFERGRFAHDIRLAVENLTDELYAEFSNATFFRPEPGRSVQASYRLRF